MLNQNRPQRRLFERLVVAAMVFGVLGFAILIAHVSNAGEIYSWETADGNVAFTDDPKNIPVRYRDQAKRRQSAGIEDYARFTTGGAADTGRYSEQLARRLEHLRGLNGERDAAPAAAGAVGVASITVSGVDLRFPAADTSAPILVEKLRVKAADQIATRHDTLVSQGGAPLAIVRGDQRGEVGGSADILDEADLEYYR